MFASLVETFMNDPLGSIGAVIAAKLVADIAAAQIGAKAGAAITTALLGSETSGPGGTVRTGGLAGKLDGKTFGGVTAGDALSAAGTGAALGIMVGTAVISANIVNFQKGEADMQASGADLNKIRALAAQPVTEDSVRQATGLRQAIEKRGAEYQKGPSVFEKGWDYAFTAAQYAGPVGWAASALGFDSSEAAAAITGNANRDVNAKTQAVMSEEARAAENKLIDALNRNTTATAALASNGGLNRGVAPSPVKN
jgi:hypothetical protein